MIATHPSPAPITLPDDLPEPAERGIRMILLCAIAGIHPTPETVEAWTEAQTAWTDDHEAEWPLIRPREENAR